MHEHSWSAPGTDVFDFKVRRFWNIPSDILLPLFPFCMEEEIRRGDYWYRDNFTRYFLVVVCLKGNILFRFEDRDIVLARGHVLMVPPGTGYLLKNADTPASHKVVIELIGNNLASDLETLGLNRVMDLPAKEYPKLADSIREIGALMEERSREDISLAVGLSYRLCTELSMLAHQSDATNSLLQRAQMQLESGFEKKLTVAMLAEELHCSASFLNKLFRRELGTTPIQYRQEKKIACARYLLCSTALTVKEIAFKLGYCDPFYFSNEFRRMTGASPSAVRREKALI
jgi:AraC-like DNA-binding protein